MTQRTQVTLLVKRFDIDCDRITSRGQIIYKSTISTQPQPRLQKHKLSNTCSDLIHCKNAHYSSMDYPFSTFTKFSEKLTCFTP